MLEVEIEVFVETAPAQPTSTRARAMAATAHEAPRTSGRGGRSCLAAKASFLLTFASTSALRCTVLWDGRRNSLRSTYLTRFGSKHHRDMVWAYCSVNRRAAKKSPQPVS